MGPALMDGWWRYGPDPVSIFATIRDGRPHGMPAIGDKMTTDEIWQLVGYVRTIGAMSVGARGAFNRAYQPLLFDVAQIPFPSAGNEQATLDALVRASLRKASRA